MKSENINLFKKFASKHMIEISNPHQGTGNYSFCGNLSCNKCIIREQCAAGVHAVFITEEEKNYLMKKYPEYFI